VALALYGNQVAFGKGSAVVVWNLRTGRTTKVGGNGDAHLGELAIAGSQVSWYANSTSNLESDDYLYTSSLLKPKPRPVAKAVRSGAQCAAGKSGDKPACAGTWLGGVVGVGKQILANRWTTNTAGTITRGGLYALKGKRFEPVASGAGTVKAVAADPKTVVVWHWRWARPTTHIATYSSTGRRLAGVRGKGPLEVAVSGRNLVVLQLDGHLALYNASTGSLRRTFGLHAKELSKDKRPYGNPKWLQGLAVYGHVAVYSRPVRFTRRGDPRESAIHALNLSSGKDRVIGRSPGQIPFARMGSVGLVYATDTEGYAPNSVVFVPLARVIGAVS